MTGRALALMVAGTLALANSAGAQPTDLYGCTSLGDPYCSDVLGPAYNPPCGRFFDIFLGRVTWYPLQCVGPITIAIETVAGHVTHFPLYIEVVPWRDPPAPCESDPGYVVFTARGVESDCGGWETSSPIDITYLVPLGSVYFIRLHYFGNRYGYSPGTDCIRVTATPTTSAVRKIDWGTVRALYR